LDYIAHINNGSEAAKPIVLHLLPGEETIFNLKVVNHGDPTNISLEASDPVFKAVRLKKPDHYVVMEETIPIMARMPDHGNRLDGEIVLTGSKGESRVPIHLLRDSEDPGIDLEDPGVLGDEDLKDDSDQDDYYDEDSDLKDEDFVQDEDAEKVAAKKTHWEEEENDSDDSENPDEMDGEEEREPEEKKEVRRIVFSRDRDLQSYKSASRPHDIEGPFEENRDRHVEERIDGRIRDRTAKKIEDRIEDQIEEKKENRAEGHRSPQGYRSDYQDFRQNPGYEARQYPNSSETDSGVADEEESYEDSRNGIIDNFGGMGAMKIIPALIFLVLVLVLVLTFVTESLPEFPGALASSILIVTLIIYGAATLLKA
jgi:hypothetical protein